MTVQERIRIQVRISMYAAFIGGVLTPLLETVRRWHQISDPHYFINWFDDYLIGGFLLFAAWKTYKIPESGHKYLIAAWGFANGMISYSFFGQLQRLNQPDPASISSTSVVLIKGIMFMICVVSLMLALRHSSPVSPTTVRHT